jgi:hypothetical protein
MRKRQGARLQKDEADTDKRKRPPLKGCQEGTPGGLWQL